MQKPNRTLLNKYSFLRYFNIKILTIFILVMMKNPLHCNSVQNTKKLFSSYKWTLFRMGNQILAVPSNELIKFVNLEEEFNGQTLKNAKLEISSKLNQKIEEIFKDKYTKIQEFSDWNNESITEQAYRKYLQYKEGDIFVDKRINNKLKYFGLDNLEFRIVKDIEKFLKKEFFGKASLISITYEQWQKNDRQKLSKLLNISSENLKELRVKSNDSFTIIEVGHHPSINMHKELIHYFEYDKSLPSEKYGMLIKPKIRIKMAKNNTKNNNMIRELLLSYVNDNNNFNNKVKPSTILASSPTLPSSFSYKILDYKQDNDPEFLIRQEKILGTEEALEYDGIFNAVLTIGSARIAKVPKAGVIIPLLICGAVYDGYTQFRKNATSKANHYKKEIYDALEKYKRHITMEASFFVNNEIDKKFKRYKKNLIYSLFYGRKVKFHEAL